MISEGLISGVQSFAPTGRGRSAGGHGGRRVARGGPRGVLLRDGPNISLSLSLSLLSCLDLCLYMYMYAHMYDDEYYYY